MITLYMALGFFAYLFIGWISYIFHRRLIVGLADKKLSDLNLAGKVFLSICIPLLGYNLLLKELTVSAVESDYSAKRDRNFYRIISLFWPAHYVCKFLMCIALLIMCMLALVITGVEKIVCSLEKNDMNIEEKKFTRLVNVLIKKPDIMQKVVDMSSGVITEQSTNSRRIRIAELTEQRKILDAQLIPLEAEEELSGDPYRGEQLSQKMKT